MLTLPWITTDPDPDGACTVIVGRLPLRTYRDLPAVMSWTRRTRRSLSVSSGIAGHAVAVEWAAPALWILSAWASRADLVRFEHSPEHQAANAALRPRLHPATFAVWTCRPADLPIAWAEARRRIDAASPSA